MTKVKTETAPLKWNTAQNILARLAADADFNNLLMFAAGFYFGLRIGDVLRLRWGHVLTPSGGKFTLREGKTGKERTLTVHPDFAKYANMAADAMGQSQEPHDFVFVNQKPGRDTSSPIGVHAANHRIKKVLERYDVKTQNPSSHTLRKTFGLRVFEANGRSEDGLILLSEIFNHRDISTTRRYIGLTAQRKAEAYLKL